ncbi:unnamed protein product [Mytilus coruscus]|uniref:Reverse transcriptase RNase H-like domain-containing protein n=1 Tax=Mytilus coruscus TaxID=42192 RepID=A0A6J8DGB3_MYTCO|nr:unnamed protein product [Mytilus coruscus]
MKITIPKGKNISEFSTLSNEYTYVAMSEKSEIPEVQNIQLVTNENGLRTDNSEQQCDLTDSPDRSEILTKIKTDFDLSDHLTDDQKSELAECLFDNLDLFVTKENPNLGYTHLVEHIIHLKPNAVGKHHKPYRFPPSKREVTEKMPFCNAIISPLTKLLKKNRKFEWKIEQSTAFQNLKTRLIVNTDNLSFPRFDLPFILAVDTSSKEIGYMLYQKDPTKEKPNIIRFGSKSLSRWQQSYGPTKLELLGMITSILDCADYLRGTEFIVECDHQALQPLLMKQFKGAIYERWLAILQQFTFEIQYKHAEQRKVADALSRCENPQNIPIESPAEDDPFFSLVTENTGDIRLPGGVKFVDLFESNDNTDVVVQAIDMVADTHTDLYNAETDEHNSLNDPYDAETDESDSYVHHCVKKFVRNNQNIEQLANNLRDFQVGANTSNITKLQRKDCDLKKIIAYLEDDVLPDSQKESRRILLESLLMTPL